MAKEQGYRSRAAYKLKQIDREFGIMGYGMVVLDLGAAPGGWIQVASEAVGEAGQVIGVDIKSIEPFGAANVKLVVGDISQAATREEVRKTLRGGIDVLLSDLSPQVSGIWDVDQFRQLELCSHALEYAEEFLKPDGWLVMKVFMGADTEAFLSKLRRRLGFMKLYHPSASRKGSSEMYVVGRRLRKRTTRPGASKPLGRPVTVDELNLSIEGLSS